MSVKLVHPPKCETPTDFKGTLLKKLKVGTDLHCESPFQPLLELSPSSDQVGYLNNDVLFFIIYCSFMISLFLKGMK